MQVILLKDVPKIGRKYDLKNVNDGYAINFLIPKQLAEAATVKKMSEIEKIKEKVRIEKNMHDELLEKSINQIKNIELIIKAKASDAGHLFSGLDKNAIVDKMKKDYNIEILPEFIALEKTIKELGLHTITVSANNKKASFKLTVTKE